MQQVYTIIGIGIGPFNLGLAALLEPVTDIKALFFDQADQFDWHPGLMLDNTTLQDPFMGTDLVTMADPTSRYSFLNFLKQTGRLYRFLIRHDFYMLRREYNVYCQWVAKQLNSCRFSHRVKGIVYHNGLYEVTVAHTHTGAEAVYYSEKLALGTGTQPIMPAFVNRAQLPGVLHSSEYLYHKEDLLRKGALTIIGSGQSAAEIFYDLLPETKYGFRLNWFTRSDRFFPMEHSKLTLEVSSPDYVNYFYELPEARRARILATQSALSKGINGSLIDQIYDMLYEMTVGNKTLPVQLRANCELLAIEPERAGGYALQFKQVQQQQTFHHATGAVLMATGYKYHTPDCIAGIESRIRRNADGLFEVRRNYTVDVNDSEIYVHNAETHTHGFTTPDLSLAAHRNSRIINAIAGREVYLIDEHIAYQDFGVEADRVAAAVPA